MNTQKRTNPFYPLLVVAGTAFAVTAFAYFVMTLRAGRDPFSSASGNASGGLMQILEQHGAVILLVELAVLGVCSVLAIVTDRYWDR